jgi:hypothetical protein
MGSSFIDMVFTSGVTTTIYYYSPIPLFTLVTLIAVNFKDLVVAFDFKEVLPVLRENHKRNIFLRGFREFQKLFIYETQVFNDYRY